MVFTQINLFTRADINELCSSGSGGAATSAKGLPFLMFLLVTAAALCFAF